MSKQLCKQLCKLSRTDDRLCTFPAAKSIELVRYKALSKKNATHDVLLHEGVFYCTRV